MPASAPLGSVHAQLRHTALRATNSPATSQPRPRFAIRRRPVQMVSRLGVPGIYPSGGLMAWHPLPSTGSLGSVPPRRRYYGTLRLPSARPAALRCLRTAVSRSHPSFVPAAAGGADHGPGVGHPVPPAGNCREGGGASQVPGEPRGGRALFSDPGGIADARPLRRRDSAFRHDHDVGSREYLHFGAQSHGPSTGCLRFAAPVTRAPRKTRFRLPAGLFRAGVDRKSTV